MSRCVMRRLPYRILRVSCFAMATARPPVSRWQPTMVVGALGVAPGTA